MSRAARRLAVLGGVYATLNAADDIGDHWVQRHGQALRKGNRTPEGQRACAAHVATYTATRIAALSAMAAVTGARLPLVRTGLILSLDAATHYWADRRYTLAAVAERTGKGGFYHAGDPKAAPCGTGSYALDQAFHHGMRLITSLAIAGGAW